MATEEEQLDGDMAGIRPTTRGRILARIFGTVALMVLVPVFFFDAAANGLTFSSSAIGALLLSTTLLTMVRVPPRGPRRVALISTSFICLTFTAIFLIARLTASPPPGPFRFVENGRRDASPPWLSQLADERETVRAGLTLSGALGLIEGPEKAHLEALLGDTYPPSFRPWPNAVLIDSSEGTDRHLEHVPQSTAKVPCLVFLHGFGGQLTAYLQVLHQAFGDRFAVVAPFLDSAGAFWTPRGKDVVRQLVIRHLPSQVDRSRLFLIGLSNGAVGATSILQDPELSQAFHGFVLVSGVGEIAAPSPGRRILLLAGKDDPRFPLDHIEGAAATLRGGGAEIRMEIFQADHFLWLSHAREMTATIDRWITPLLEQ